MSVVGGTGTTSRQPPTLEVWGIGVGWGATGGRTILVLVLVVLAVPVGIILVGGVVVLAGVAVAGALPSQLGRIVGLWVAVGWTVGR